MRNSSMDTGDIELHAVALELLNESQVPPFVITDPVDASEALRFKHRYLDLRRPSMQKTLRQRAKVNQYIRSYLEEQRFTEVETPILYKSTPEGGAEFLVPSRTNLGQFYALPQSPSCLNNSLWWQGLIATIRLCAVLEMKTCAQTVNQSLPNSTVSFLLLTKMMFLKCLQV